MEAPPSNPQQPIAGSPKHHRRPQVTSLFAQRDSNNEFLMLWLISVYHKDIGIQVYSLICDNAIMRPPLSSSFTLAVSILQVKQWRLDVSCTWNLIWLI